MNTAKNVYPFRKSEEARHEIEAGMQEYENHRRALTAEETRARFTKARVEWDEQWGGKCPYKISEVAASRPIEKPSLWQRIRNWYDRNWEECFEGVGPAILALVLIMFFTVVFVNLGRATGWWGGVW